MGTTPSSQARPRPSLARKPKLQRQYKNEAQCDKGKPKTALREGCDGFTDRQKRGTLRIRRLVFSHTTRDPLVRDGIGPLFWGPTSKISLEQEGIHHKRPVNPEFYVCEWRIAPSNRRIVRWDSTPWNLTEERGTLRMASI